MSVPVPVLWSMYSGGCCGECRSGLVEYRFVPGCPQNSVQVSTFSTQPARMQRFSVPVLRDCAWEPLHQSKSRNIETSKQLHRISVPVTSNPTVQLVSLPIHDVWQGSTAWSPMGRVTSDWPIPSLSSPHFLSTVTLATLVLMHCRATLLFLFHLGW